MFKRPLEQNLGCQKSIRINDLPLGIQLESKKKGTGTSITKY
jgi:hypothetical protein